MTDVTLPQLGETVTEGTITQWFKSVGDTVELDEPLFEVSTDKVDSEVPSPGSGVLTEIRVPEGETVDVGTVLAVLGEAADAPDAEPTSEAAGASPDRPDDAAAADSNRVAAEPADNDSAADRGRPHEDSPAGSPVQASSASGGTGTAPTGEEASARGVLLSPVVRSLVDEHGLDVAAIEGTGPGGRITRSDVEAIIDRQASGRPRSSPQPSDRPSSSPAPPRAPAPAETRSPSGSGVPTPQAAAPGERDTVEPFNKMRKLTGEHMVYSKSVAPHVLMTSEIDYEGVEAVRRAHGADFEADEGFALNYLPFISLAVVDAIREFPKVNASVGDGALVIHHDINLGIAVDLHHEGLIVPVIHAADGLRLRAVAREIRALVQRARSNELTADDVTGGTFTVSNPGPYGTHFTAAIISQPEVAILSTEGVSRKPVVVTAPDGTEAIGIHSVGLVALSFDHRAFDGAYAAAFLAQIKANLETRDWAVELA